MQKAAPRKSLQYCWVTDTHPSNGNEVPDDSSVTKEAIIGRTSETKFLVGDNQFPYPMLFAYRVHSQGWKGFSGRKFSHRGFPANQKPANLMPNAHANFAAFSRHRLIVQSPVAVVVLAFCLFVEIPKHWGVKPVLLSFVDRKICASAQTRQYGSSHG